MANKIKTKILAYQGKDYEIYNEWETHYSIYQYRLGGIVRGFINLANGLDYKSLLKDYAENTGHYADRCIDKEEKCKSIITNLIKNGDKLYLINWEEEADEWDNH